MYRDELDVSEHIQFMLCVHVYKCVYVIAPKAMNLYRSVSVIETVAVFNGWRTACCTTSKDFKVWEKTFLVR